MTNEVRFNRDEYAKSYYREYYQNNKEKINQARKKRITIERIVMTYGVKLNDELYAMYNENREIYNKIFKQLKQNKKHNINYTDTNPHLVEYFTNHIIV